MKKFNNKQLIEMEIIDIIQIGLFFTNLDKKVCFFFTLTLCILMKIILFRVNSRFEFHVRHSNLIKTLDQAKLRWLRAGLN